MPNTITDRAAEEQTRLTKRREIAGAAYPQLFGRMSAEWNAPDAEDGAWLMYSANYVLRTAGVLLALDPLTLPWRVPSAPAVDTSQAFEQLRFVLLTHSHTDHLDFNLLRTLQNLPLSWVIPEYLLQRVQAVISLPEDRVIVPRPMQAIDILGIHLIPFEGHHFEEFPAASGKRHGVPATAYLVEFNGKRWLFPGDTRNYSATFPVLPGPLDGIFAHVWLGRGSALLDEPPLLDQFCRFCAGFQPKRVVLTHLEEYGRDVDDYWTERHARMVISRCKQIAPEVPITAFYIGDVVRL